MAIEGKTPRDRLLIKMVDPRHVDRIAQWIYWQHLERSNPKKYRLIRCGVDFMLMMKLENGFWATAAFCDRWFPPLKRIK